MRELAIAWCWAIIKVVACALVLWLGAILAINIAAGDTKHRLSKLNKEVGKKKREADLDSRSSGADVDNLASASSSSSSLRYRGRKKQAREDNVPSTSFIEEENMMMKRRRAWAMANWQRPFTLEIWR